MDDQQSILYDFDAETFAAVCHDPHGVRVEIIEFTGVRLRDIDELMKSITTKLAERFSERPDWRRIVVWSDAGWLAAHDRAEYDQLRTILEEDLRRIQNPWRLPLTGQVGGVVLQGSLPVTLEAHRIGERFDLDYTRERPPERRAQRRPLR